MRVTDRRVFEADPDDPSTPSLKGGEIHNTATTSRAIARKRGGFGKAWGDILLPEGRTVAHLMEEALTRAFQDAGLSGRWKKRCTTQWRDTGRSGYREVLDLDDPRFLGPYAGMQDTCPG